MVVQGREGGGRGRAGAVWGFGVRSCESIKLSLMVTESRGFSLHPLSPSCDPEQQVSHQRCDSELTSTGAWLPEWGLVVLRRR